MAPVVAALECRAAVDAREVGALTAAFVGVEFGLLDGVVADFAGDCECECECVSGGEVQLGGECGCRLTGDHICCGGGGGGGEVRLRRSVFFFFFSFLCGAARLCGLGGQVLGLRSTA